MKKHEWRKQEKSLYIPKNVPTVITVEKQKFLTIKGKGNPGTSEDFQKRIEALYTLSYKIKMTLKTECEEDGYTDYTVYPLEGIWDLENGREAGEKLNKDDLVYKIMIRQPEFVNEEVFIKALEISKSKKENPFLDEVVFEEVEDGLCVQMLHVGSFDNEDSSFKIINEYLEANNYERKSMNHREIYLSDFRRVSEDKLKTTLRVFVKEK